VLTALQAAAVSAQHSREVAGLQAQLSALQRQHKQLQGKCAQQARDLREASESAKAARGQQQGLQGELQDLRKQLQGKAAALSRWIDEALYGFMCTAHAGDVLPDNVSHVLPTQAATPPSKN
jgi:chromosome segregation ATPase